MRQSGMTLVEVAVVVAVTTILGLAIATLQVINTNSTRAFSAFREVTTVTDDVSMILADSDSCAATLTGVAITPAGTPISTIKAKDSSGAVVVRASAGQTFQYVNLESMTLDSYTSVESPTVGTANLTLVFSKRGIMGGDIHRVVPIGLRLNAGGNVIGCVADRETFLSGACATLGGTFASGLCFDWNVNGNITVARDILGRSALAVNGAFVAAGASQLSGALTANRLVANQAQVGGSMTGTTLATGSVTAGTIYSSGPICVGGTCRSFSATSCPGGWAANGVDASGMLSCFPFPPPPPPPPPPPIKGGP